MSPGSPKTPPHNLHNQPMSFGAFLENGVPRTDNLYEFGISQQPNSNTGSQRSQQPVYSDFDERNIIEMVYQLPTDNIITSKAKSVFIFCCRLA